MISQKFGLIPTSERSLEVLLTGTLLASCSEYRINRRTKDSLLVVLYPPKYMIKPIDPAV